MSSSSTQRPINISVAGRYRLGRKIGSGSFGDLFVGASSEEGVCRSKKRGLRCAAPPSPLRVWPSHAPAGA